MKTISSHRLRPIVQTCCRRVLHPFRREAPTGEVYGPWSIYESGLRISMADYPLVTVGIVTWNSATHLPECLASLVRQMYPAIELIVVDNNSADRSLAIIQETYPAARLIRNPVNTGFCRAHNQAIRAARGRYYLPLNPDVRLDPGYIAALVEALECHPECGSAAGKLWQTLEPDGSRRIDSTGLFLDRRRRQYLRGHGELDAGQYDQAEEIFGVDGAAPMYRRVMLEDICIDGEYFDESFFAHKEDVDIAWRAQLLGWRCYYVPQATAYHPRNFRPGRRETVSPAVRVDAVKNRYLLLLKNESPAGWKRDGLRILGYDLQILGYLILFEHSSLAALRSLGQQWSRARQWRREIWQRARTDPAGILAWFV